MYVFANGDHLYTLNHDLKRLEQMKECDDPENMMASTDYRIREDQQQVNYKMIEHIDDILGILRDSKKPEEGEEAPITYLVQKDNDMEGILWERAFFSRCFRISGKVLC